MMVSSTIAKFIALLWSQRQMQGLKVEKNELLGCFRRNLCIVDHFGHIKSNYGRKILMFDLDSVWTFALVLILHAHEERFPLVLIFHYYSLFGCNQMWSFDQVKCAADIKNAKHLIFPGVGAFGTAIDSIRKQGYALLWKMYSTLTGMIAFILW